MCKELTLIKSKERVQQHGEVFTPQWVVDKMTAIPGIKEKTEDVFAAFLEPSAGEGAFLVAIENLKLQYLTDNYEKDKWSTYALWVLTSIYGIELLEDNLKIARKKMLNLFADYYQRIYGQELAVKSDIYKSAQIIINANIVQGDTLTYKNSYDKDITFSRWETVDSGLKKVKRIPFTYASLLSDTQNGSEFIQASFFDMEQVSLNDDNQVTEYAICDIEKVWVTGTTERKEKKDTNNKFKFDVVIGNPPYQEESTGEGTQAPPIYHRFMEEAYKVADRVSFITPARFLFNAGATPKAWNKQMLEDEHLKVVYFEQDSSKVFRNTNIMGGIAVTYRDSSVKLGAVGTFTAFKELNTILHKTSGTKTSFSSIIYGQEIYKYTDRLHSDYPEAESMLSDNHKYDIKSSAFDKLNNIFFDNKPIDEHEYIQIIGLQNNKRIYKWVRRNYITEHESLSKYKVFLSAAHGAPALGDIPTKMISNPLIGNPLVATTQTFLTIGSFDTENEASAAQKYICTKFVRVLLGVLKVTQHNTSAKWKYVPIQDFTTNSDIDWSKPIPDIDRQLYKKYGLDDIEIEFIESHVKEMP